MVDLENTWLDIYGNDLENHMVEADDLMVRWCFKRKVRAPLTLPGAGIIHG
jgi:hypothetical protein